MSKLTITEAVERIAPSESTLRRDMKSGKVSFETDPKGRKLIDVSELTRVYGQLKRQNGTPTPVEEAEPVNDTHQTPPVNRNGTPQNQSTTENDSKVIMLLENQVADLKTQLAQASERETALQSEKSKLLDMLSAEQEKTRVLMLPNPEQEAERKNKGWLLRLIEAR